MHIITGAIGFIGMHTAEKLLERGETIVGIDNFNDYYDTRLKHARLEQLEKFPNFTFIKGDIAKADFVLDTFRHYKPRKVLNLAAQAGVRYSLENPSAYIQSNIVGFANILEGCRQAEVEHLVYASSSSVYGANQKIPFSETDSVDYPVSLYAATKKSNELMAHTYSHLYGLPTTGLRYFTVYGPWGRPDMSPWLFTSAIIEGRPIKVFNYGEMERDFTYIDDISSGTLSVMDTIPTSQIENESQSTAPYKVYNIGNNQPVKLLDYIKVIEQALGKKAELELMPMQPGDVEKTFADIDALEAATGFKPSTSLEAGIAKWVAWYKQYHHLD